MLARDFFRFCQALLLLAVFAVTTCIMAFQLEAIQFRYNLGFVACESPSMPCTHVIHLSQAKRSSQSLQ